MEPPPTSGPARYLQQPRRPQRWMELEVERVVRMVAHGSLVHGQHVGQAKAPQGVVAPHHVAQDERRANDIGHRRGRPGTSPAGGAGCAPRRRTGRTTARRRRSAPLTDDPGAGQLPLHHVRRARSAPCVGSARRRPRPRAPWWRRPASPHRSGSADAGLDVPTTAPRFSKMRTWATSVACLERLRPLAPRDDDGAHLVVGEFGHRSGGVVVVADHLGGSAGPPGPVDVVPVARLRRLRREHRKVVGEDEHPPVVGIGRVDPAGPRGASALSSDGRLLGSDDLADPRAGHPGAR